MRLFDVTTPKTTVDLGSSGTTSVVFNVSNVSGRTARANFNIAPVDPAKAAWFSFPSDAAPGFDFSQQNGTTQVQVNVSPQDALPGNYSFKLRAIDAQDPGRSYDESPTVGFTVKPKEIKPFPWWIVIAIVVILAIIGGVIAYVKRPITPPVATTVTVPNVEGYVFTLGVTPPGLAAVGLKSTLGAGRWACLVGPNRIITVTNPPPGAIVPAGSTITLTISPACTHLKGHDQLLPGYKLMPSVLPKGAL
jgi:hypothetical protein